MLALPCLFPLRGACTEAEILVFYFLFLACLDLLATFFCGSTHGKLAKLSHQMALKKILRIKESQLPKPKLLHCVHTTHREAGILTQEYLSPDWLHHEAAKPT